MEVKGVITQILEKESGVSKAGKDWEKQGFVVDTGAQYNPEVCFGLFGDKLSILESFKVGDEVEVFANVSSREFNGKWYHSIDCWRMIKAEQSEPVGVVVDGGGKAVTDDGDNDDLPF